MPLFSVENVTRRFGGIVALDDVSFTIDEGEIVGPDRPERRRQDDARST